MGFLHRRRAKDRTPEPDPDLDPFRGGVAVLHRDGEVRGHIASEVSYFWSRPRNQWWVWFVIVWADGTKDRLIEDYAPWTYVREMQQGYIDLVGTTNDGTYAIEWIPASEATRVRETLGIRPEDF